MSLVNGKPPAGCTFARLWIARSQAASRVKSAKQLGIVCVEAEADGKKVMLRFAVPDSIGFGATTCRGAAKVGAAIILDRLDEVDANESNTPPTAPAAPPTGQQSLPLSLRGKSHDYENRSS